MANRPTARKKYTGYTNKITWNDIVNRHDMDDSVKRAERGGVSYDIKENSPRAKIVAKKREKDRQITLQHERATYGGSNRRVYTRGPASDKPWTLGGPRAAERSESKGPKASEYNWVNTPPIRNAPIQKLEWRRPKRKK